MEGRMGAGLCALATGVLFEQATASVFSRPGGGTGSDRCI